jgi:hypothetical protein
MVMALHGDEGSPLVAIRYFWGPVWASHQDFILVMPKCPAANGSWWDSDTHAHVGFIDDVIDDVAGKYNVDIDRVYAIGYSGGSVWLGWHGFQFQDVFAGIQWCCGGSNAWYTAPPRDTCKVDGRFHISDDDFLWNGARDVYETMVAYGHEAEWVTALCSGHCCAPGRSEAGDALQWFLGRTKCDGTAGSGCGDIRDLPTPAMSIILDGVFSATGKPPGRVDGSAYGYPESPFSYLTQPNLILKETKVRQTAVPEHRKEW